jgi:hypothetical protein
MPPVVKRIASANDVLPAPRLPMTATFLRDLAPGSFIGPSLVVAKGICAPRNPDHYMVACSPVLCMMR